MKYVSEDILLHNSFSTPEWKEYLSNKEDIFIKHEAIAPTYWILVRPWGDALHTI